MREELERRSLTELRVMAKQLKVPRYSGLRKDELIEQLLSVEPTRVKGVLFPTWWSKHHNHVYGVITVLGLLISIGFFSWERYYDQPPLGRSEMGGSSRRVPVIESPIRFRDYAEMIPDARQAVFDEKIGAETIWEGYLVQTIGFQVQTLEGVPFEKELGLRLKPTRTPAPLLTVEVRVEPVLPTDSGYELVTRLNQVSIGQRLRVSGKLNGKPDAPVLTDGWLEAVFPLEQ